MNLPPIPTRDPLTAPTWITWFSSVASVLRAESAQRISIKSEIEILGNRDQSIETNAEILAERVMVLESEMETLKVRVGTLETKLVELETELKNTNLRVGALEAYSGIAHGTNV
jgi:chromosome segregation ATPase